MLKPTRTELAAGTASSTRVCMPAAHPASDGPAASNLCRALGSRRLMSTREPGFGSALRIRLSIAQADAAVADGARDHSLQYGHRVGTTRSSMPLTRALRAAIQ